MTRKLISIFGLGYVGSVTSACLADIGHKVIGVDINPNKVDQINKGLSPIVELGLSDLINKGVQSNNLSATTDPLYAINNSDISFIAVGTPSNSNGSLDISFVEAIIDDIGTLLKNKKSRHTIILRSTVLPSSCEKKLIPILESSSGLKVGEDIGFVFNPEFLREGTAIYDFYNPPKTVIGCNNTKDGQIVSELYSFLDASEFVTSINTAEMVKYADNAFHATKVVFGNEIGAISKSLNINSHEVMEIFCSDTKLNISSYYLKPGFAFGGSCLPKDVRALSYMAKDKSINTPMIDSLIESNNQHINRAFSVLKKYTDLKVGFLGFSFKDGTDDTRESPIISLIEICSKNNFDIKVHDPNINIDRLIGSNKDFLDGSQFNMRENFIEDIRDFLSSCDLIVIGNPNKDFINLIIENTKDQLIFDLVGLDFNGSIDNRYIGFCW